MIIFLDELEKILKKYNQPYTIHDWIAQMNLDKQNWSKSKNWIFENGKLILTTKNKNLIFNNVEDIFAECFDWVSFDIKFSHHDNYIEQIDLSKLFLEKFSIIDYFYDPKKIKIINYKIIYRYKKNFKKINFKIKKLKI